MIRRAARALVAMFSRRGRFAQSLEAVWAYREETLYPALFGSTRRGIFTLDQAFFAQVFGEERVDPRWLFLGVFEFAPTAQRPSWLYVTSGMSNPWETEARDYRLDETSWLGVEFVLETPVQADWPIHALRRLMAYHLLLCHGRLGDNPPLAAGHRVPAGGTVDGSKDSALTVFAFVQPEHYPAQAALASGKFDFLHVVGITEGERELAWQSSTAELVARLAGHGAFPVTDPRRRDLV